MTKIHLTGATAQQRLLLAQQVEMIRRRRDMTQAALAEAAGLSRNTIVNIERGGSAPQEEKLRRIFAALGVATDTDELDPEVEGWLSMLGSLITAISRDHRADAVDEAAAGLLRTSRAHPADVGGMPEDALRSRYDLAASEKYTQNISDEDDLNP